MALREKGRWRRWFGLPGNVFYYDERPKKKRLANPAIWSVAIAALSTLSTAIFAWQNYRLSEANYSATHHPKFTFESGFATGLDHVESYTVALTNEGDAIATNVRAFTFATPVIQAKGAMVSFGQVGPGGMIYLDFLPAARVSPSKKEPQILDTHLLYTDRQGTPQRPQRFCCIFDGETLKNIPCEGLNNPLPSPTTGESTEN